MSPRGGGPAILALAATLLVLAGCGSSALSDPALRQDATRACQLAEARTDRISTPSAPSAGEAFLRHGVSALRPELTLLRGLAPPHAVRESYDAAVAVFADELSTLESAIQRLQHGSDPVTTFQALQQRLVPLERREDSAWHSLQIPACMNSVS